MRKSFYLKVIGWILACALMLAGCSGDDRAEERISAGSEQETTKEVRTKETETEADRVSQETEPEETTGGPEAEPEIVDADWSEVFNGLNGTAVIYDAAGGRYTIYNQEQATTRRPPCSTFKIISSLIAL